jgi:hypothetical protein
LSVGLLSVSRVAEKFFVLFGLVAVCVLGFVFVRLCFLGCVWCGFWVFYYTLMGDLMGGLITFFAGLSRENLPTDKFTEPSKIEKLI